MEPLSRAPEALLESPSCPLCGAQRPAAGGFRFPPYRVLRCPGCGLWYLSPRLAEAAMLQAYREDSYFEGDGAGSAGGAGYSSYRAQEATLRATFRRFLEVMEKRGMTGGGLLEVGSAYGYFLDEARPYFERRVGTEYSPAAAARAAQVADVVHLGGLAEIPAGELFDCAVVIHVLEHIYHPLEFIGSVLERLRPGGWVILACPDMGSFWRRLAGRRWPFFKIPEHVTYFTRASMRRLLADAGSDRVETLPYSSFFTVDLIGEKLGVSVPRWLGDRRLWLPAITVACAGRKPARP